MRKCNDSNNVFSARKRSVSGKCFICAKAKRQQQKVYLCESEATATNVLSVRKRSDSNKKKRPVGTKSTTRLGDELFILQKDCQHKCPSTQGENIRERRTNNKQNR
ncbi:hypothetical protein [Lysinibacillus sphaericus]|uniref:hypothetical protein n=1 Tax=Lysinibacillus sphaericus TaxID=1421 RepID=UPI001CC0C148|nr:hypothetical protein [Lysinibacillus sphaericus]